MGPVSGTLDNAEALTMAVGEVMIRAPKTLPGDASVGEVRRMFEKPSIRTVLLTDGRAFAGAIERDGFAAEAPDDAPARSYVQPESATATPGMPMSEAVKLLDGRDEPRLVVLDDDGVTLAGLLCVNSTATGFCVR
jgi:CBS domain-containing protein